METYRGLNLAPETKVKVIDGGIGARFANGVVGKVIDRPISKPISYGGGIWDDAETELYIIDEFGNVAGLCRGYEVEVIEKHFTEMTKEEQEKINQYDLREMAHYYGSWDELKKVIAQLEDSDNEPREDSDAWSGGFADNH